MTTVVTDAARGRALAPRVPGPGGPSRARLRIATLAGRLAGPISRRLGLGDGAIIGGRVASTIAPDVLRHLAEGRTGVVVVTGTNGKTTTSHFVAAALAGHGPIAHNAGGSNMVDGVTAALLAAPHARRVVLEVDELSLGAVLDQVRPNVVVLLNLSRDQLDRAGEVATVARSIRARLAGHPETVVVANADDPWIVWAAGGADRCEWVGTGSRWRGDAGSCPCCACLLREEPDGGWSCTRCAFRRPTPSWRWNAGDTRADGPRESVPLTVRLPGAVNGANGLMALAAVAHLGVPPIEAATALGKVTTVAGRYAVHEHRGRRVRLLLVKNPAGWSETSDMMVADRPVVWAVNAREADGRDTSWLWDLSLRSLHGRRVVVAGERAADLGVRLSYAEIDHDLHADPIDAIEALPPGDVDVVVNYTVLLALHRRLTRTASRG